MPLEEYFLAYGKQDRQPGELVEAIEVPLVAAPERLKCYKISKRFDQDISAVCGCFNIDVGRRHGAPRRASPSAAWRARRSGLPMSRRRWPAGRGRSPPSRRPCRRSSGLCADHDMRGSAGYRMQVARNLLVRYFHETERPLRESRLVGRGAAFA